MQQKPALFTSAPSRLRALCAVVLGSIATAQAAPLTVVNSGFEDIGGEVVVNEFTFGPQPGWSLYDPDNVTDGGDGPTFYVGTLTPFQPDPVGAPGAYANIPNGAPEGQRVAIAFNFANSGGQGEYGVQQTLADTLAANMRYTLQVNVINIASATSSSGQFFELSGFPGYRVELRAGNEVLAADLNGLGGVLADGEVGTSTVVFDSGANPLAQGEQLTIRLVNLNIVDAAHAGSDLEVDFDNVRLSAVAVPLPSMTPLAFALGALALRRRRRRVG
jgi:hapalindole H/12-epi-hapalindole U/12-epi-fischerindole U synthase